MPLLIEETLNSLAGSFIVDGRETNCELVYQHVDGYARRYIPR